LTLVAKKSSIGTKNRRPKRERLKDPRVLRMLAPGVEAKQEHEEIRKREPQAKRMERKTESREGKERARGEGG
jgi:hypothetical protein